MTRRVYEPSLKQNGVYLIHPCPSPHAVDTETPPHPSVDTSDAETTIDLFRPVCNEVAMAACREIKEAILDNSDTLDSMGVLAR
ncbi:unnamed protein product [Protopolystoma xenopodis]|uniref:Uncharacterized protein n=1 Tax=Protopolystoma xenopodis TaxID=117903 RepID=A0A3S5BQT3_9PLAT|nr:unnamed protein product [Protopolystoma xenopodis]